jgi:hypothetical protein
MKEQLLKNNTLNGNKELFVINSKKADKNKSSVIIHESLFTINFIDKEIVQTNLNVKSTYLVAVV